MEVLDHLAKQTDKILEEINVLKKDIIEIKTHYSYVKESAKDHEEKLTKHHDRLVRLESHTNLHKDIFGWISKNILALLSMLVATLAWLKHYVKFAT